MPKAMHMIQERQLKEAQAASRDRAEAVAAEMDAMRENALAAALAEARHSLAALQRQHEAGQRSLAELQVPQSHTTHPMLPIDAPDSSPRTMLRATKAVLPYAYSTF